MICRSPITLRSSTNPALTISYPGRESIFGSFFNSLRTWWLTLDRHWGAFIIAGGPPGFSNRAMPRDAARVINRQYLIQHQNSLSVRYLIADDEDLPEDLNWAGYRFERRTKHGFRYCKITWQPCSVISRSYPRRVVVLRTRYPRVKGINGQRWSGLGTRRRSERNAAVAPAHLTEPPAGVP